MKSISVIGLGWFGAAFAESAKSQYQIMGSHSTNHKVAESKADGIKRYYFNLLDADSFGNLSALFDTDAVILNIPPSLGGLGKEGAYGKAMRQILKELNNSKVLQLIFISSTGVFGGHQFLVNEMTAPEPDTENGRILLEAEKLFLREFKQTSIIIRPAGLVGGNRHPGRFMAEKQDIKGRLHPVNIVHREDLILAVHGAMAAKRTAIYHAVASEHPSKQAFYTAAAIALGAPAPDFLIKDKSSGKMVSGEWTKNQLDAAFRYENPMAMLENWS